VLGDSGEEPNLYSALYNCGNIDLMDGRYKEAEHLLSRAMELDPQQAGPKHFLGALSSKMDEMQRRRVICCKLCHESERLGLPLLARGVVGAERNIPAARAEYQRALRLNQIARKRNYG